MSLLLRPIVFVPCVPVGLVFAAGAGGVPAYPRPRRRILQLSDPAQVWRQEEGGRDAAKTACRRLRQ